MVESCHTVDMAVFVVYTGYRVLDESPVCFLVGLRTAEYIRKNAGML